MKDSDQKILDAMANEHCAAHLCDVLLDQLTKDMSTIKRYQRARGLLDRCRQEVHDLLDAEDEEEDSK